MPELCRSVHSGPISRQPGFSKANLSALELPKLRNSGRGAPTSSLRLSTLDVERQSDPLALRRYLCVKLAQAIIQSAAIEIRNGAVIAVRAWAAKA